MPPERRPPARVARAAKRQQAIPCQTGERAGRGTKTRLKRCRPPPPLRMQRGIRSPASGLSRPCDLSNQAADRDLYADKRNPSMRRTFAGFLAVAAMSIALPAFAADAE